MAWNPLTSSEIQSGKVWSVDQTTKVKECLDYLNSQLASLGAVDIPNGSFELDSDGDGIPDSWTWSAYPGGTTGIETTSPAHGAAAIKQVHPGGAGNGGGYHESDYVPCSELQQEIISLIHWASAAGMHNVVEITFYTAAKVVISTAQLYDSTANPTAPTRMLLGITPPATARYYKLRLLGGHSDTDVAGTAYWDGVTRLARPSVIDITNTAASASGTNTTWTDIATITITLPYASNLPMLLSLPVTVDGNNSGGTPITGSARLRSGTNYSNVITRTDKTAGPECAICTLKTSPAATADGGTSLSIQLQGKTSQASIPTATTVAANTVTGVY